MKTLGISAYTRMRLFAEKKMRLCSSGHFRLHTFEHLPKKKIYAYDSFGLYSIHPHAPSRREEDALMLIRAFPAPYL